ncbi:MAG: monooxygenase [Methyloversatilis discipulorum]|uniref:acyl-CoA dehydrogenase family protein n=1 Tax=Methyloversatilis discipulorum TaxID=1119528 RepID=UPI0026EC05AD|nr:acyl-CoA dehydrogenase family protein [Methyloversatilis discipulorum]MBT9516026.1 monooxygenase [Methyloversatilis discipulorum]
MSHVSVPPAAGTQQSRSGTATVITSDDEAIRAAHAAAEIIAELARDPANERQLPVRQADLLSTSGLTGICVTREHGGLGASVKTIVDTVRIVSSADGGVGQILQIHHVMARGLVTSDDESIRAFFSRELLAGKRLGNALAEVGGKNKFDQKTRIETDAEGKLRLNGSKFYATGSYLADWISVSARGADGTPGGALVARNAPGVTALDDWHAFGQRHSVSGTILFDNVEVDPSIQSPRRGPPTRTGLTFPQILHAAIDTGIAAGALAAAIDYLNTHSRAWVESGVEHPNQEPLIINRIGQYAVAVRTAEVALRYAADVFDQHNARPDDHDLATELILAVATARAKSDEASLFIGSDLFSLLGASSSLEKWNLDRFWRDARVHTTHDPIRWRLQHVGNFYLNGVDPGEYNQITQARQGV